MGVINKRNAIIGWLAIKVGKQAVKKTAHDVAPSKRTGGAAAGAAATIAGVLFVRRRKRDSTGGA